MTTNGWECPKCHHVWAPGTPGCTSCNNISDPDRYTAHKKIRRYTDSLTCDGLRSYTYQRLDYSTALVVGTWDTFDGATVALFDRKGELISTHFITGVGLEEAGLGRR